MNVTILTRYPRVDTAEWKRVAAEGILDSGAELAIVYTRAAFVDQVQAGLREFGPGALARYREARSRPAAEAEASSPTLADWAATRGVAVHRHRSIHDEDLRRSLAATAPDVLVLAGADIVPPEVLAIPEVATINPHYGLLPRYRGMNVAEWSVFHDDPVGVTVHAVDAGIDTGDIIGRETVDVVPGDTLASIRSKQQALSAELLVRVVRQLGDGTAERTPQLPEEGRQFYRMHPELRAAVERKLAHGAYRPSAVV